MKNKMPAKKKLSPMPLFDIMANIKKAKLGISIKLSFSSNDFNVARSFLKEYNGNQATFSFVLIKPLVDYEQMVLVKKLMDYKLQQCIG